MRLYSSAVNRRLASPPNDASQMVYQPSGAPSPERDITTLHQPHPPLRLDLEFAS